MRSIFLLLLALCFGCSGKPCKSQSDCEVGSYCVLDVSGGTVDGECVSDCIEAADCEQGDSKLTRAVCTNLGQCRIEALPPKLRVFEPEDDTLFPEGTRSIRVTGEVESAADLVLIEVRAVTNSGCRGGLTKKATVRNPQPGEVNALPFVVDNIKLDPGVATIHVEAAVHGSQDRGVEVLVEIDCPGCAEISIQSPSSAAGLELPRLSGEVAPTTIDAAIWRVHSVVGDVFDGTLPMQGGSFSLDRIPLFAGVNHVEVVVSGVGTGLGESRCSTIISSAVAREKGLRAVLSWDAETDLDLHIIGPSGMFGDPLSTLSSRSLNPSFGGKLQDDFDGYGPEIAQIETMDDGTYGVIVEPVFDGSESGSNLIMRVLMEGRSVSRGPIGPAYLSAKLGELWVAGTLVIVGDNAEWHPIGDIISATLPPTKPPVEWPTFY